MKRNIILRVRVYTYIYVDLSCLINNCIGEYGVVGRSPPHASPGTTYNFSTSGPISSVKHGRCSVHCDFDTRTIRFVNAHTAYHIPTLYTYRALL